MAELELVVRARAKDLGGFSVRRSLPYPTHRMVGPFIFFDHMGPAEFAPGEGVNVRPHPHVNLATVTYLFEGQIRHRDSLGSDQLIEPGAINWMIAGRGIVHSERTTDEEKAHARKIHGIQLWVALPTEHEEIAPSFTHHAKETLPEFESGGTKLKLLLGEALGHKSPVPVLSKMFYLEARLAKGTRFKFKPDAKCEVAAYIVAGNVSANDQDIEAMSLAIAKEGDSLEVEALEDSRVMFLGGLPLGKRFIEWNFVSSSAERIKEVKKLWQAGPSAANERFHPVPGDDREFIPLPPEPKNSVQER